MRFLTSLHVPCALAHPLGCVPLSDGSGFINREEFEASGGLLEFARDVLSLPLKELRTLLSMGASATRAARLLRKFSSIEAASNALADGQFDEVEMQGQVPTPRSPKACLVNGQVRSWPRVTAIIPRIGSVTCSVETCSVTCSMAEGMFNGQQ